jgi:hypothetical protein
MSHDNRSSGRRSGIIRDTGSFRGQEGSPAHSFDNRWQSNDMKMTQIQLDIIIAENIRMVLHF